MFESISKSLHKIISKIKAKPVIRQEDLTGIVSEIRASLIEADVNVRVVRRFLNRCVQAAEGRQVTKGVTVTEEFVAILHEVLTGILGSEKKSLTVQRGEKILMVGLQGSGKTTTIAKISNYLQKRNMSSYVIAADRTRPAGVEQLQQLGDQHGFSVFSGGNTVKEAIKKGLSEYPRTNADVCIIDSAGRHGLSVELLEEIKDVHKLAKPQHVLFVVDATIGQTAAELAQAITEYVPVSGVILSKCDADSRGGAALSVSEIAKCPILFLGTGEHADNLEEFNPEGFANRIFGMGDVVQLVERAREVVDEEEAQKLRKKAAKSQFTLNDLLQQFATIKKMGSIKSIMELLPQDIRGQMNSASDPDETVYKKQEALILSMTFEERENPRILNASRQKRIARGAGSSQFELRKLLKNFEQVKNQMKKFAKKR